MDMIYTNAEHIELGFLQRCNLDMELGSSILSSARNDFTITMSIDNLPAELRNGALVYEIGSEYGGIVNGIGANTATNKATVYGTTWRGMLSQKVITPPNGKAYYQARGEANTVLSDLIDKEFDGLIIADGFTTDITVNRDYRYTNLLEGIEKMLIDQNARLDIKTAYVDKQIKVYVSAIPVNDFTSDIELNNDYGIALDAKKIKSGVNHVICLGKGELTDRTVIHLYKLANGQITMDSTNAIKGKDERTITYDYSSAETEEDLIEGGKKKFDENCDEESLAMTISEKVEIGDIVGARERVTGIYMSKPVTQKILKGYIDNVKIDYKVGD